MLLDGFLKLSPIVQCSKSRTGIVCLYAYLLLTRMRYSYLSPGGWQSSWFSTELATQPFPLYFEDVVMRPEVLKCTNYRNLPNMMHEVVMQGCHITILWHKCRLSDLFAFIWWIDVFSWLEYLHRFVHRKENCGTPLRRWTFWLTYLSEWCRGENIILGINVAAAQREGPKQNISQCCALILQHRYQLHCIFPKTA